MKICAFGLRKFPPSAGAAGADTFAFNLFNRFALDGHEVVVFEKGWSFSRRYEQTVLVHTLPTVPIKGVSTFIHSFLCSLFIIIYYRPDVAHTQNGGNAIFCWLIRIFGIRSFCSFDGVDKNRKDWGFWGRNYLKLSEKIAVRLGRNLVVDNLPTQKYLFMKYGIEISHIPFGSEVPEITSRENPIRRLTESPYVLFVGRFVADKDIITLIAAFKKTKASKTHKLVLVGGPSEKETEYSMAVKNEQSDNVLVPGFYYGDEVTNIISDAKLYVQPSLVEGLSPVVLQVVGIGTPVLVSDIPENKVIISDEHYTFRVSDPEHLSEKIDSLLSEGTTDRYDSIVDKVREQYGWEKVYQMHLQIFKESSK